MNSFRLPARYVQLALVLLILAVFIFFRVYKLNESLLFYNDAGRDSLVLLNWSETGKPPLLGPQTSVLSYNQSAWYFYFLYPLFYFSKFSAFSSTYTLLLVSITVFCFLLNLLKRNNVTFVAIAFVLTLISVQPQIVLQNRFVWNPSFLPLFLTVSLSSLYQLKRSFSKLWAFLFWLFSALAIGFSYSAVPFVFLTGILVLAFNRKNVWQHFKFIILSAFIVLLPMLLFEIRHSFTLTRLMLAGQTTPQTNLSLELKIDTLLDLVFPTNYFLDKYVTTLITLCLYTFGIFLAIQRKYRYTSFFFILVSLTTALVIAMLFLPINLEKHYIFPVIISFIFSIAFMPRPLHLLGTLFFALIWAQPYFIKYHTAAPVRTVADMETCYRNFCQTHSEPLYVSMESGILPGYHNALEHQFLLRKEGCKVLDIETSQNDSQIMAVINDAAEIDPGKSGYRELSLFGSYVKKEKFICTENLSIQVLSKPSADTPPEKIFHPQ